MFLTMATVDQTYRIQQLIGREKQQQHLMNMGLVPGATIRVVSTIQNNIILVVKDSRLAISRELAQKLIVEPVATDVDVPAATNTERSFT